MARTIEQTITVECDGPGCTVSALVNGPNEIPPDWIGMVGPPGVLGQVNFEFHNGACYDGWRANVNTFLAQRAAEESERQAAARTVTDAPRITKERIAPRPPSPPPTR